MLFTPRIVGHTYIQKPGRCKFFKEMPKECRDMMSLNVDQSHPGDLNFVMVTPPS